MSDQNRNAQPPSFDKQPKNAGGIDDIDENEDRVEVEDPIEAEGRGEKDDARQAGGSRERRGGVESDSSDGR
jgi:hypothetical protein